MPFASEAFSTLGQVTVREGRRISAEDVRAADMLAVRSTTRVNRALLEGSSVKFVGTATIGTDHMDLDYLEEAGIRWCYSPGCNATSVAEYIVGALLCLANRHAFALAGKTIGVIGVGNVGSRVVERARALGMRVLQNDPPRQRMAAGESSGAGTAEDGQESAFVDLDFLLAQSDIVTLHVPLTHEGQDATLHMAGEDFFGKMKPGCVFLNSARGAVAATDALVAAVRAGTVAHAVIDTWEGEPSCSDDLLELVDLATPHIAGYSYDGKVCGTVMVYKEACAFLGREALWSPADLLPPPPVPAVGLDASGREDEDVLHALVRRVYDIESDDTRLRETRSGDAGARAAAFDELRKAYPVRREFRFTRAALDNASDTLLRKAAGLGFRLT
jgi:erythronate-4-phosphate dehydrogenase